MKTYKQIIAQFSKKSVLVIGDVILDRHIQGSVHRISPEAPVPIVLEEKSFYTPGGAANVAQNLSALGSGVIPLARIGNDVEGQILKRQLKKSGIDVRGLFVDKNVPTITKTRVIAQHQQVVRIDRENSVAITDKATKQKIMAFLKKNIALVDAVIISDYGKGLITPDLVTAAQQEARKRKIPISVDPKVEHFGSYCGVTVITPNKKVAENAIRNIKIQEKRGSQLGITKDKLQTSEDVDRAGTQLLKFLDLESLLITLGEQGMRLFEKGKKPAHIDTRAQEVFDVTGAGDAVISVFTLALTCGASKKQAAELANSAAGIVVGRMGAVAVTKADLSAVIKGQKLS